MNKGVDFIKSVRPNFQNFTITALILSYIWWFRVNPFAFGPGEQASDPLIFGLILLFIYIFIISRMKFSHEDSRVRSDSYVFAALLFAVNVSFVFFYLPRVRASAHFASTTYYITSNGPFFECCGYHQFTKWQGIHYDSHFFAYSMPPLKFIHDDKSDQVSVVKIYEDSEQLDVTLGEQGRHYEGYAQLGNHLYYGSNNCNLRQGYNCESWTYSLYQCALDNASCIMLPVEYTGIYGDIDLQADELTNEIFYYIGETLIYTHGEHPRCFVEDCSITK